MAKDYIDSFLSELEREEIVKFNTNVIMREAVRKVLLASIYKNGTLAPNEPGKPLVNAAFSLASSRGEFTDEQLGRDLRAMWEGVNALEAGLNQLLKYEGEAPKNEEELVTNPAI